MAYMAQQDAMSYGVASYVLPDDVYDANRGPGASPAFSSHGQIFMRETLPEEGKSIGPHEVTHVMMQRGFPPYVDFVKRTPGMVDTANWKILRILAAVAADKGLDIFSLTESGQIRLWDEVDAIVYGHIAAGEWEELERIRDCFYDFDKYAQELTEIHEQFKNRDRGGLWSSADNDAETEEDET